MDSLCPSEGFLTCVKSHTWDTVFNVPPGDSVCKQPAPTTELLAPSARFEPAILELEGRHATNQAMEVVRVAEEAGDLAKSKRKAES